MKNIYKRLFKEKTPFAYAADCALIVGLGSVVATTTDIYWLLGDMSVQVHSHHWIVLIGLIISDIILVYSFIWLYKSINSYIIKKHNITKRAQQDLQERIKRRDTEPHFSNRVNKKINHLNGVTEFED